MNKNLWHILNRNKNLPNMHFIESKWLFKKMKDGQYVACIVEGVLPKLPEFIYSIDNKSSF